MKRAAAAGGILLATVAALLVLIYVAGALASWWVDPRYGGIKGTIDYCSSPQS